MKHPKVIASECFAGLYPQNTLSGFKYCVDQKVDGIEFDVHLTADGHVVVQHDYFLNKRITRDSGGEWLAESGAPLCHRSLAELKTYDVGRYLPGSYEATTYTDYSPIDAEPIPTLDEFLAYHRDQDSGAELWIELKTSPFQRETTSDPLALTDAVLAAIARFELADQCVLLAFEWDLLARAQILNPEVRTNFLTVNPDLMRSLNRRSGDIDTQLLYGSTRQVDELRVWEAVAGAHGHWWGPYVIDATQESVAAAQAAGIKVNLWGVESKDAAIYEALALGADAITLDRPDLVHAQTTHLR